MVTTGMKIKLIRTLLEMSQKDFAKRLFISPPLLSYIETDKLAVTDEIAARVEAAFNVKLDDPRIEGFVSLKTPDDPSAPPDSLKKTSVLAGQPVAA